jgi:hypothetical protein
MKIDNTPEIKEETIPDTDSLFYRIHKTKIDREESDEYRKIKLLAFDPMPQGTTQMSTDWSAYSSAIELQNRAKIPEDNGIVYFNVGEVRNAPFPLSVKHDPTLTEHVKNWAHSIIFDIPLRKNDIGIRLKLRACLKI